MRTAPVDWNDSQPTRDFVDSHEHHPGELVMPQVRFAWSAQLVDVRRQACPRAKWNARQRARTMTDADAEIFLAAGHSRLDMTRESSEVAIDGERWIIGFFEGAPCRRA